MPTTLHDLPEIEYLDGRPHRKMSPRLTHGRVQFALASAIAQAAGTRGVTVTEVRFAPDSSGASKTELVPDVAYISNERLASLTDEQREKPPFSPDIAAEVRSPSDDLRHLQRKIARYLATGAILVLDVDPSQRCIVAHASDGVRRFSSDEAFNHPAAPWLQFEVASVF